MVGQSKTQKRPARSTSKSNVSVKSEVSSAAGSILVSMTSRRTRLSGTGPVIRATTEEAWAARADVRFAASAVPALRGNRYVLTHNPGMFHLWGVNAGQMSQVVGNPSYLDYLATRYAGGVYVHWNFWCNVQVPEQRELCRAVRALKPWETVREYRERDYAFAFYRVVVPALSPTLAP